MKKPANRKGLILFVSLAVLVLLPWVTVAAGDGATAATPKSPEFLTLTLGEFLGILAGLAALSVSLGKILWDWAHHRGQNLDAALTARVQASQSDREWVERLEKAHEKGGDGLKTALGAVIGVLQNMAPLTPFKIDDALRDLLKDIQTPGTPDALGTPVIPLQESSTSAG